jgi:hypothetical protein
MGALSDIVYDFDARKIYRKLLAPALAALMGGDGYALRCRLGGFGQGLGSLNSHA